MCREQPEAAEGASSESETAVRDEPRDADGSEEVWEALSDRWEPGLAALLKKCFCGQP